MSIPRFELDISIPLDTKKAISYFGSEDTYYRLLQQYEDVSLLNDLKELAKAVNDNNYKEVKERIHSIKGASAYAGASRVTDHCYWMQYYYLEDQFDKMMDLYPKLMESVVEFRVWHR
jgi:HPt (histidine-containing phosphotransfer) domain-containing protein